MSPASYRAAPPRVGRPHRTPSSQVPETTFPPAPVFQTHPRRGSSALGRCVFREAGGMVPGVFRLSPVSGETTLSFLCRIAACYGLEEQALLSCWRWHGHRPRHDGGGLRADAEVLLDAAGRRALVECPGPGKRRWRGRCRPGAGGLEFYGGGGRRCAGGVAGRGRGSGTGGLRVPFVCGSAYRGRGACGAVRATVEASVCPARAVGSGRGRRSDAGAPGPARHPGGGGGTAAVARGGPARGTGGN